MQKERYERRLTSQDTECHHKDPLVLKSIGEPTGQKHCYVCREPVESQDLHGILENPGARMHRDGCTAYWLLSKEAQGVDEPGFSLTYDGEIVPLGGRERIIADMLAQEGVKGPQESLRHRLSNMAVRGVMHALFLPAYIIAKGDGMSRESYDASHPAKCGAVAGLGALAAVGYAFGAYELAEWLNHADRVPMSDIGSVVCGAGVFLTQLFAGPIIADDQENQELEKEEELRKKALCLLLQKKRNVVAHFQPQQDLSSKLTEKTM
ncbi:hypothetical protein GF342_00600 [Candidatus Woesearchaeota archaeon]|nr:hypothetical protein [Candidatus Woesearchaeota archaeon]